VLTTEVVRELNEEVDVGGELEDGVAEQFLKDNGFVSWLPRTPGPARVSSEPDPNGEEVRAHHPRPGRL
jgi:hypothetical protein